MIESMKRMASLALVLGLVVLGGCKDAEVNEIADETAVAATAEPVKEVVEDAAGQTPSPAADMAFYPMPENPPGHDLLEGPAHVRPEITKPDVGGECPVTVVYNGELTKVTIRSITLNCCTERVQPSLEIVDGVAEIRIYEYMPDVCECQMQRSVMFMLSGFDPTGMELRVYSNANDKPCYVVAEVE